MDDTYLLKTNRVPEDAVCGNKGGGTSPWSLAQAVNRASSARGLDMHSSTKGRPSPRLQSAVDYRIAKDVHAAGVSEKGRVPVYSIRHGVNPATFPFKVPHGRPSELPADA